MDVVTAPEAATTVPHQEPEQVHLTRPQLDALLEQAGQQAVERLRKAMVQEAREAARQELIKEWTRQQQADQLKLRQEQSRKWTHLAQSLGQQFAKLREQLEDEVFDTSLVAVTRMLGRAWADPTQWRGLVQELLREHASEGRLKLLMHPEDARVWSDGAMPDWPAELVVIADERVSLGGCLIETAGQGLDARLETQLQLLREALESARVLRRQSMAAPSESARG